MRKKFTSRVFPGAALVRATGWRTSALIKLDLPTLDRPTIATSGSWSRGKSPAPAALVTNSAATFIDESTNRRIYELRLMKSGRSQQFVNSYIRQFVN